MIFKGTDRLIDDIESMIGPKPKWFWKIWTISWKFISPIVLIVLIVLNINEKNYFCFILIIFF